MNTPNTQKEVVLWYLYNWKSFSMLDVMRDSKLYKFPARLSDLEKEYGQLAHREKKHFTNRFNHSGVYFQYSAIDKAYIKAIYDDIQKQRSS